MLRGSLIILDGFDEFVSGRTNESGTISFSGFYDEVQECAGRLNCNVIITSRTMCIEAELKGTKFNDPSETNVASFAPMKIDRQRAMIDRMIELERIGRNKKGSCSSAEKQEKEVAEWERKAKQLEDYRDNVLEKIWLGSNQKYEKIEELLRVPILFRMITAMQFRDFEQTDTVAELYSHLFHSLLKYKKYEETERR